MNNMKKLLTFVLILASVQAYGQTHKALKGIDTSIRIDKAMGYLIEIPKKQPVYQGFVIQMNKEDTLIAIHAILLDNGKVEFKHEKCYHKNGEYYNLIGNKINNIFMISSPQIFNTK